MNTDMKLKLFTTLVLGAALLLPITASAGTFEVSGWMPYWRGATSTADVLPHLNELTEINPFVYTLSSSGAIKDNGPMSTSTWQTVVAAAHAQNVRVVPTIMSSSGSTIYTLLSSAKSRQKLEKDIVKLVKDNGYDGIDIDFENKTAATKDYFSLFLKGLYQKIGDKFVTCDIEARTPISEAFYGSEVPATAGVYANDYVQINKYCDRVHIMAYDQQGVDSYLAATAASSSQLYAPVGDPAWVRSVIKLAEQTISPKKIVIGVPTYGYEYQVTAYANNQYTYDILWTFDPGYASQIEKQYNVTPVRNSAGEMSLTYTPLETSTAPVSPLSGSSMDGLTAAAAASLYATTYNSHLAFNMLDWSDAQSIKDKVALAKELGVRGVALFEFDGGEDPGVWNALLGAKR